MDYLIEPHDPLPDCDCGDCARHERNRLRDAAWLPIDTAPTDGSAVMVTNGRGVWVAKHKAVFQSGYKPDSPWFCLMLNKDHIPARLRAGAPTHWMPLPKAPNV